MQAACAGCDVGRVAIGRAAPEQDLATPSAEVAATVANGGYGRTFVEQVTEPDGRVTDKLPLVTLDRDAN